MYIPDARKLSRHKKKGLKKTSGLSVILYPAAICHQVVDFAAEAHTGKTPAAE